jgi:Reverse transcriptase (RNA-dependent DNA polymerase).
VEIWHVDNKTYKLKSYISLFKEIKHGIPQGSVLGPFLLLLYVNNLPLNLQGAKVIIFVEDTNTVLTEINQKYFQENTESVMKHRKLVLNNDLVTNTEKTKVMLFQGKESGSNIRPILHFRTKELNNASNLKFLGIHIIENFKWYTHIQYLCHKQNKVFYIIKSLQDIVNIPVLRNIHSTKFKLILR